MKIRHRGEHAREVLPVDSPGFVVEPGEEFEVDADLGRNLLAQSDNFAPADDQARQAVAETEDARSLPDQVGDMHVNDVLPLLATLDADQLAEVRAAEEAGKARVTVLSRIDELTAAPSEEA